MGRLDGKVAFITGAARGQGRSHAIRMAQEGADIIAIDLAKQIDTVPYGMATPDDLAETVRQVEALDRRIVASEADVRDYEGLKAALDEGVAQLGKLDIVSANAGIFSNATAEELTDEAWNDMIAVNLTGVWHTAKAAIPHLRANGGGSIIITSSTAGIKGFPNFVHYVASKHGVVGVMRTLALELAPDSIRVNTVHPTSVDTDMIQNDALYALFMPDLPEDQRTKDEFRGRMATMNALPVPWVEAVDISNAVLWLASDESRYVTGVQLPVDAGSTQK
ncbi:mycofactocin-coupled SDR family oxidoreductase [Microbacterium immunditiarum]|uniref:SDR family mycofactocin-dependent oxidoreductase n=1 Tax=Microbacterium immunditiarum TaxID=337480 RepID=A0A7Y9GKE9_9MICO|nr:mycofactocin-coupled SDR family oxidoreductase [Microbacterium immunditiarum]NYE18152.1 SDR family mycofactocin-dependent oxidoreductase [Microbacterium immunditiarum]